MKLFFIILKISFDSWSWSSNWLVFKFNLQKFNLSIDSWIKESILQTLLDTSLSLIMLFFDKILLSNADLELKSDFFKADIL